MRTAVGTLMISFFLSHISAASGSDKATSGGSPVRFVAGEPSTSGNAAGVSTIDGMRLIGCNSDQQKQIAHAAVASNEMITGAISYLRDTGAGRRYTAWFGVYDSNHFDTIASRFTNIEGQSTSLVYDCQACQRNTLFNTIKRLKMTLYHSKNGNKYTLKLCPNFWELPDRHATTSKAGMILRELAHINGASHTNNTPQSAQQRAIKSPAAAAREAANYMYFALNTPAAMLGGQLFEY